MQTSLQTQRTAQRHSDSSDGRALEQSKHGTAAGSEKPQHSEHSEQTAPPALSVAALLSLCCFLRCWPKICMHRACTARALCKCVATECMRGAAAGAAASPVRRALRCATNEEWGESTDSTALRQSTPAAKTKLRTRRSGSGSGIGRRRRAGRRERERRRSAAAAVAVALTPSSAAAAALLLRAHCCSPLTAWPTFPPL